MTFKPWHVHARFIISIMVIGLPLLDQAYYLPHARMQHQNACGHHQNACMHHQNACMHACMHHQKAQHDSPMQLCRLQSEDFLSDPGRSALGRLRVTGLQLGPVRTQPRNHYAKLVC